MIETQYLLHVVRSAVIAADGTALIDCGPDAPFERWVIQYTQVANDGANATVLRIYSNPSRSQLVEGTYAGRLDTSDTEFELRPNQHLYYQWSGGTVGSRCSLSLRGHKFVAGNRASG